MEDKFVGDVGDFGKYGLLRAHCDSGVAGDTNRDLRLGVVWYLVPNSPRGNDGKHRTYLEPNTKNLSLYRACDPNLYDLLREPRMRSVAAVERSGILPAGTQFFAETLDFEKARDLAARVSFRKQWFQRALDAVDGCDLVFLDPDNGFADRDHGFARSVSRTSASGCRYAFSDELLPFVRRGQSVVLYHHPGRARSHDIQVGQILDMLRSQVPRHLVTVLRFHRGTSRAFVVLAAERIAPLVSARMSRFMSQPWKQHFTRHS